MRKLLLLTVRLFMIVSLLLSCAGDVDNYSGKDFPGLAVKDSSLKADSVVPVAEKKDTSEQVMTLQVVPADDISIKGIATYNLSYCSGAAPPQSVLDELAQPRKLRNTKILFINHDHKEHREAAKTDEEGNFKAELDAGTWDYYLTKEVDEKLGLDPKCDKWFTKLYGSLKVPGDRSEVLEPLFHLDCDPCDPTIKMRP